MCYVKYVILQGRRNVKVKTGKKVSLAKSIDVFLKEDIQSRNRWITDRFLKVYLRRSHRRLDDGSYRSALDLATIEVAESHQGKGVFKRWLKLLATKDLSEFDIVYVENVQEEQFQQFFERTGWAKIMNKMPDHCYYKFTPLKIME